MTGVVMCMQAAKIFKVPYAAVAIIDRKRVWMKAIHSVNERTYEVPRDTSFASFMLLNEKKEVMVVEDTQEDGRCAAHPRDQSFIAFCKLQDILPQLLIASAWHQLLPSLQ